LRLNILAGNKSGRIPILLKELDNQGIEDYRIWQGLFLPSIKESINRSHKQIVEWAWENDLDEVCIAEDDILFFDKGAWDYFLNQKPNEYDLYLGMIFLGQPDQNNTVKDFTGLTIYCVHKRFYSRFLTTKDDEHLDVALKNLGEYYVCNPFIATQHNGISSNTGKWEDYDRLLEGRPIFKI
jgi:hypothetical protein